MELTMASPLDSLTGPEAQNFIKKIESIFKVAPHLPKGIINFLVMIVPWGALLGGIFGLIGSISLLTGSSLGWGMTRWLRWAGVSTTYYLVLGVFQLVTSVLLLLAFNQLKNKKFAGWMLLFWISLIGIAQNAVGIFFGYNSIIGTLISAVISLYLLFEVKPSYKK